MTRGDLILALRGAAYIRRQAVGQLPDTQAAMLRWATAIDSAVMAARLKMEPVFLLGAALLAALLVMALAGCH